MTSLTNTPLIFWALALANMWLMISLATMGIVQAKKKKLGAHQRLMGISAGLVVAFVLAYGCKLLFVGREDLGDWPMLPLTILRCHELFILVMLLAGGRAGYYAWQFSKQRQGAVVEPVVAKQQRARHRQAGKVACGAAYLATLTATLLLFTMYQL